MFGFVQTDCLCSVIFLTTYKNRQCQTIVAEMSSRTRQTYLIFDDSQTPETCRCCCCMMFSWRINGFLVENNGTSNKIYFQHFFRTSHYTLCIHSTRSCVCVSVCILFVPSKVSYLKIDDFLSRTPRQIQHNELTPSSARNQFPTQWLHPVVC